MSDNTCNENPMQGMPLDINFSTFLYSLSSSAMVALGEVPNPETNQVEFSPQVAKHTIDVLSMLQDKFNNGLEGDEKKLLCDLLYSLRMAYVSKTK